jgi:L-ascorbate metabolism protein UlaG (beta-lactamase superfamily)
MYILNTEVPMRENVLRDLYVLLAAGGPHAGRSFPEDIFPPAPLELRITFIAHATLMIRYGDTVIHVDPIGEYTNYSRLAKADIILVTHEHSDHLDPVAIQAVRKDSTTLIATEKCLAKAPDAMVMRNGDTREVHGIQVTAIPAYNIRHVRSPGVPFHPKGMGNGYLLALGSRKVYVGGDTEDTPEMRRLTGVDIAFLPMNLPYTMTPEMVANAALAIRPKVLYPYHFGDTDANKLIALLGSTPDIEVRIRPMR